MTLADNELVRFVTQRHVVDVANISKIDDIHCFAQEAGGDGESFQLSDMVRMALMSCRPNTEHTDVMRR
jgi:hypothetical protein